jgi:hypothetical protein
MTISHRQAQKYSNMALDGTLSAAKQARLEEHLADCAECRAYAQEWGQFDDVMTRSLAGLGDAPPASPQKVADTLTAIAVRRQRWRMWHPFQVSGRVVLNAAMLLVLIAAAFWFLRPPETAVDSPTLSPEPQATAVPVGITSLISDYVVVHFDFGGSSDGLELVHPTCDGMSAMPQPEALSQAVGSGETPYCELINSNTLLFQPGETRQVLLIFRNNNENEIDLTFTPETITDMNRPFIQGICRRDRVRNNETCASSTVGGGGVWASYVDLTAPDTAVLGESIVVPIQIRARELAIKPTG